MTTVVMTTVPMSIFAATFLNGAISGAQTGILSSLLSLGCTSARLGTPPHSHPYANLSSFGLAPPCGPFALCIDGPTCSSAGLVSFALTPSGMCDRCDWVSLTSKSSSGCVRAVEAAECVEWTGSIVDHCLSSVPGSGGMV
jgi:hypothetical protein